MTVTPIEELADTVKDLLATLLATKDHINLFLYDPTVPTPMASSTRAKAT